MADSNRGSSSPSEKAQPFLYTAPNARTPSGAAGPASANAAQHSADYLAAEQKKAYEKGLSEGQALARAEVEKSVADMRAQIAAMVRDFSSARAVYFGRVEAEVVRLSLSIARKILHRESHIDPSVLTGVVHVALQKLNGDTKVRLRANPDEVRFWHDYFKHTKDIFPFVDVLGDSTLSQGQCTLETDFGSTEISFDTQLREIEQGFFDLLEQRPKGAQ